MRKTLPFIIILVFLSPAVFAGSVNSHLKKGHNFLMKGSAWEAEREYLRVLEKDPKNGEAYTELGTIEMKRKHYGKAIAYFKKAISSGTVTPETFINLAYCQRKQGKLQEAAETYQSLIKIHPELAEAHLGLGNIYQLMGKTEKAEQEYSIYRNQQ